MKGTIKMKLPEKLIDLIENAGFVIREEGDDVLNFSRISPAGQDFDFSIDTENDLELFTNNIFVYYSTFDVSYETLLWLDDTGHGTNGAPYDMKDVYEDMEECAGYILQLYRIVCRYLDEGGD